MNLLPDMFLEPTYLEYADFGLIGLADGKLTVLSGIYPCTYYSIISIVYFIISNNHKCQVQLGTDVF